MITHIAGGGSSYADAVKKSALKIGIDLRKEKCVYVISNLTSITSLHEDESSTADIEIEDEFERYLFSGEKGGTIVFSTDVNSADFSENPFKNWLFKKFKTLKNRLSVFSFLDKLRTKNDIKAWTIGRYFVGSYTGKNGKTFNEKSFALNIIDVDRKTLFKLAQEIREQLGQESVLVHDATTQQIYFVDGN